MKPSGLNESCPASGRACCYIADLDVYRNSSSLVELELETMKIDMRKAMRVDMPLTARIEFLGSWEKLARGVNETLRASPATPAASLQKGEGSRIPVGTQSHLAIKGSLLL